MENIIVGAGLVIVGMFGVLIRLLPRNAREQLKKQIEEVDGE